jgi:hypothetical protein
MYKKLPSPEALFASIPFGKSTQLKNTISQLPDAGEDYNILFLYPSTQKEHSQ